MAYFDVGMNLLAEAVRFPARTEQDRATALMVGVAYQLFASCWTNLRQGRIAAAVSQTRPLSELYEYIGAAGLRPEFAERWLDSLNGVTVDVYAARRIIKKELEAIEKGSGKYFEQYRKQELNVIQAFSHISPEMALGIFSEAERGAGFPIAPAGVVTPATCALAARLVWRLKDFVAGCCGPLILRSTADWQSRAAAFGQGDWSDMVAATDDAMQKAWEWSRSLPGNAGRAEVVTNNE